MSRNESSIGHFPAAHSFQSDGFEDGYEVFCQDEKYCVRGAARAWVNLGHDVVDWRKAPWAASV